MQRVAVTVVVFLAFCSAARAAGRQLMQPAVPVTATIRISRPGRSQNICSATVLLRTADGAPVPGASVTYNWGAGSKTGTVTSNSSGRFTVMAPVGSSSTSCSLQLVDIAASGAALALSDTSRSPRTFSWQ